MTDRDPTRIAVFSAEAAPFAKDGGLGDVVGALPKELRKMGVVLSLVLPGYASTLRQEAFGIHPCPTVKSLNVTMGNRAEHAEIFHSRLNHSDVDVYFIGSRKYFQRPGIYNNPRTGEGYRDNGIRFAFFMKAGLELLAGLGSPVDLIHCHDCQTALIPGIIKTYFRGDPFYRNVGTLLTIHNLAYQGIYPRKILHYAGIDGQYFYPMSPFEYWDKVNFMKAGILMADKVNTVSQTYAREIRSSEFGYGLEGVLESRAEDLSGIVNGIDYEEWNPETDPIIAANFSAGNLRGKVKCKEDLLRRFRLPSIGKETPLIGVVSRLVEQKGLDLIEAAAAELAALKVQMVVLGVGQLKYHEMLHRIVSRYPDHFAVDLSFDNELAHKVQAGSDMFLMPSRYEPCGLSQLVSLRYGTIPIVRSTGGLADTIAPYENGEGTGFTFKAYSADEMLAAVEKALSIYSQCDRWQDLMVRAMGEDWSWKRSAKGYQRLYESIREYKRSGSGGVR
jgi:starch synthase